MRIAASFLFPIRPSLFLFLCLQPLSDRNKANIQMARFRRTADRALCLDSMLIVDPAPRPLQPIVMDRDRNDCWFIRGSLVKSHTSSTDDITPRPVPQPVHNAVMEDRGDSLEDKTEPVTEDSIHEVYEEPAFYPEESEPAFATVEPVPPSAFAATTAAAGAGGGVAVANKVKREKNKKKKTEYGDEFHEEDTENSESITASVPVKKKKKKKKPAPGEGEDYSSSGHADETDFSESQTRSKTKKKKKKKAEEENQSNNAYEEYSQSMLKKKKKKKKKKPEEENQSDSAYPDEEESSTSFSHDGAIDVV